MDLKGNPTVLMSPCEHCYLLPFPGWMMNHPIAQLTAAAHHLPGSLLCPGYSRNIMTSLYSLLFPEFPDVLSNCSEFLLSTKSSSMPLSFSLKHFSELLKFPLRLQGGSLILLSTWPYIPFGLGYSWELCCSSLSCRTHSVSSKKLKEHSVFSIHHVNCYF